MEKLVLHKVGAEGWGKTDQTRLDIRIIIFHNYVSMYTIFVCCMISMSMYTYIYIYMHAGACTCICICTSICICIWIWMCICTL